MARAATARKLAPVEETPLEPVAPAIIGHNNPPPASSLDNDDRAWSLYLEERFRMARERRDALLASFTRFRDGYPTIPDEDVQARAGDLRAKLADLQKLANSLHTLEKAPLLVATRAVDGFRNNFLRDVDAAVVLIKRRQTEFAEKQLMERRRAAEEEARLKREEADAIAAAAMSSMTTDMLDAAENASRQADRAEAVADAPARDLTRTYGDAGSVTSLKTRWVFQPEKSDLMGLARAVVDGRAPVEFIAFNTIRINVAVKSDGLRNLAGCVIEETHTV